MELLRERALLRQWGSTGKAPAGAGKVERGSCKWLYSFSHCITSCNKLSFPQLNPPVFIVTILFYFGHVHTATFRSDNRI